MMCVPATARATQTTLSARGSNAGPGLQRSRPRGVPTTQHRVARAGPTDQRGNRLVLSITVTRDYLTRADDFRSTIGLRDPPDARRHSGYGFEINATDQPTTHPGPASAHVQGRPGHPLRRSRARALDAPVPSGRQPWSALRDGPGRDLRPSAWADQAGDRRRLGSEVVRRHVVEELLKALNHLVRVVDVFVELERAVLDDLVIDEDRRVDADRERQGIRRAGIDLDLARLR